jgi:hypothetical protein
MISATLLTEWTSPETLEAGSMLGAFLESRMISEIIKSWWQNGKRAPMYLPITSTIYNVAAGMV